MKIQQNLRFSRDMATMRISVFLLLFLSQTWAETEELQMVDMKKDVERDNGEINVTVDLWAELKELRDMVIEQKIDLSNSKSKIEKLEEGKSVLDAEIEELKRQITASPKVAFSVGLTDAGEIGPFNYQTPLKFSKVFTNYGHGYNTHAGLFTAPLRGVYYFRFTGVSSKTNEWFGLALVHNDETMTWTHDTNDDLHYATVSNGFVLELEKGDIVYLALPQGHYIYDDSDNRTVFSGFLIFPL